MDLEHEVTLASGMNITYSNTTVSDGTLWFKPGEWTLPQLTITTPRWVACSLPKAIESPSSVGCPCQNKDCGMSAINIDLNMQSVLCNRLKSARICPYTAFTWQHACGGSLFCGSTCDAAGSVQTDCSGLTDGWQGLIHLMNDVSNTLHMPGEGGINEAHAASNPYRHCSGQMQLHCFHLTELAFRIFPVLICSTGSPSPPTFWVLLQV